METELGLVKSIERWKPALRMMLSSLGYVDVILGRLAEVTPDQEIQDSYFLAHSGMASMLPTSKASPAILSEPCFATRASRRS